MKNAEIQVGRNYRVKVPLHVDTSLWHRAHHERPRVPTIAVCVEKGVTYMVPEYQTYGGIAGSPRVTTGHHANDNGIRFRVVSTGDRRDWYDGTEFVVLPSAVEWEDWSTREEAS
jgi:hypothetical protein